MPEFTYFRQPIGTDEENATGVVWCGFWFDATGYARKYRIGSPAEAYHTGADLNCNPPGHFDFDKLSAVYSIGDGEIIHAARFPVWGNIIIARYILEDARAIYARYAHVDSKVDGGLMVKPGQLVRKGEQIARVGNAFDTMAYHLHFDISPTEVLKDHPDDWPKLNLARLKANYADPLVWLQARTPPAVNTTHMVEITANTLYIRNYPSPTATITGKLKKGDRVWLHNASPVNNKYHWQRLDGDPANRWIAIEYTTQVEE